MNEEAKTVCPICGGEGYIYSVDENGYEFTKVCSCELARQTKARLRRSGLVRVEENTLAGFKTDEPWQKTIKDLAQGYLQEEDAPWFYIGGQPGCGKTHICTAICLELINQGESVQYEIWATMAGRLKTMRNTEDFDREMQRLQTTQILYMDDFFRGWISDSDRSLAWEIINGRYIGNRRTIISSELYTSEVRGIDEAIASRIYQMAGKYVLPVKREEERNQRYKK